MRIKQKVKLKATNRSQIQQVPGSTPEASWISDLAIACFGGRTRTKMQSMNVVAILSIVMVAVYTLNTSGMGAIDSSSTTTSIKNVLTPKSHFGSTPTDCNDWYASNIVKRRPKPLIVLVQGEASMLRRWVDRLLEVTHAASQEDFVGSHPGQEIPGGIKLIYASFDKIIDNTTDGALNCNRPIEDEDQLFACDTFFIPNSTWTQGRNALARAAWCDQRKQGFNYTYWSFSDDDAELKCLLPPDYTTNHVGPMCYHHFFRWLTTEAASMKIPYIPMNYDISNKVRTGSHFDAIFNSFHFDYVPYLLPYAYMPPGTSQWQSQAVNYAVMDTCLNEQGLSPPFFAAHNALKRPYARGLNLGEIINITMDNYLHYVPQITVPEDLSWKRGAKEWATMTEAEGHIVAMQAQVNKTGIKEPCGNLPRRFENFIHRTNQINKPDSVSICDILPFMSNAP